MSGPEPLDSTDREAETAAWLAHFAALLDAAALPAVLIGGQSRNFWTEPRVTYDFDFTVAALPGPFFALLQLLIDEGYVPIREQGMGDPSGPDFVCLQHPGTGAAIDLQASKTPFQDSVLERAQRLEAGQYLAVATPEDIIVLKLIAFRLKDYPDLDALSRREGLDWAYIEHWARIWGVEDRLEQMRSWPA